jgi:hypothetical protein
MLLRVGEQVIELLIGAICLDVHADADLLVSGRHAVVQPEQALQVEIAGKPAGCSSARQGSRPALTDACSGR